MKITHETTDQEIEDYIDSIQDQLMLPIDDIPKFNREVIASFFKEYEIVSS